MSAPWRPNENLMEGDIREMKKRWYWIYVMLKVPDSLWDYVITYVCETGNLTVNSSRYSNRRTPLEIITGETSDVSDYLDFGFYDWINYRTNTALGQPDIRSWLEVSHRVENLMSYWILLESGIVISCTTVQRVTNFKKQTEDYTQ